MPQKLNEYVKDLEGFSERALNMHNALKINPDSFQSFMDMEKEIAKEIAKEMNKKRIEKERKKYLMNNNKN